MLFLKRSEETSGYDASHGKAWVSASPCQDNHAIALARSVIQILAATGQVYRGSSYMSHSTFRRTICRHDLPGQLSCCHKLLSVHEACEGVAVVNGCNMLRPYPQLSLQVSAVRSQCILGASKLIGRWRALMGHMSCQSQLPMHIL